jgi:hypothetical protein
MRTFYFSTPVLLLVGHHSQLPSFSCTIDFNYTKIVGQVYKQKDKKSQSLTRCIFKNCASWTRAPFQINITCQIGLIRILVMYDLINDNIRSCFLRLRARVIKRN